VDEVYIFCVPECVRVWQLGPFVFVDLRFPSFVLVRPSILLEHVWVCVTNDECKITQTHHAIARNAC